MSQTFRVHFSDGSSHDVTAESAVAARNLATRAIALVADQARERAGSCVTKVKVVRECGK